jgi:hypothetical protein
MLTIRSRWLILAAAFVLLPACSDKGKQAATDATANATPAKTVLTTVQLLKSGQFDPLMQHVLPPAAYQQMRADWQKQHDKIGKISDADRRKFAKNMAQLTAPDAEQKIWAQVKPQLEKMDKQYQARMPMMIGFGQIALSTQISNSKQLTPDQKKQANDLVSTLGTWAQNTHWTDPAKVKQAIGVVTGTARKLDLKTLDQAVALPYAKAMQKYGVAWNGVKQMLDIYGLSLDKTLDSFSAKTLSSTADDARVQVAYTLLDKPQQLTVHMVKKDGRWYDKDLLDHWQKMQQREQAASASSTAGVASATPAGAASAAR